MDRCFIFVADKLGGSVSEFDKHVVLSGELVAKGDLNHGKLTDLYEVVHIKSNKIWRVA